MPDFDHCLREVFTQRVVKELEKGRSIKLIGGDPSERERLLEDIRQMDFPDTTILSVNMKKFRLSYDGLLKELWAQLGRKDEKPENISELIERYEGQDGRLWILMENFDALLGKKDVASHYNVAFYDALNYVKNRPNIALICATQQPHDQSIVFLEEEAQRTSWIDLEAMHLPPLRHGEIVEEVKRLELPVSVRERSALIETLREYEEPYRLSYKLLKFIENKFLNRENADQVFEKRLKLWLKQFQKTANKKLLSKKSGLTARQEISAWSGATGISSLKGIFSIVGKPLSFIANILENFAQKREKNDDK